MQALTAGQSTLSANDISYIVNLICPGCGGPLGAPAEEFRCQGRCRKDWRRDWERRIAAASVNSLTRRSRALENRSAYILFRRHPRRSRSASVKVGK